MIEALMTTQGAPRSRVVGTARQHIVDGVLEQCMRLGAVQVPQTQRGVEQCQVASQTIGGGVSGTVCVDGSVQIAQCDEATPFLVELCAQQHVIAIRYSINDGARRIDPRRRRCICTAHQLTLPVTIIIIVIVVVVVVVGVVRLRLARRIDQRQENGRLIVVV